MPSEAFGGNTADEVACVVTFIIVWRRLIFFFFPSFLSPDLGIRAGPSKIQ